MSIQIKKLSDPKLSADGQSVRFTAHAERGPNLRAVFPIEELEGVTQSLIGLLTSAKITAVAALQGKEIYGKKDENGWSEAPHSVLVSDFQNMDNPETGAFLLRLRDIRGHVVDVSFQPQHVEALKRMILEAGPPKTVTGLH